MWAREIVLGAREGRSVWVRVGEERACVKEPGDQQRQNQNPMTTDGGCTAVLLDTRVCSGNWVWCGVPHYQYRAAGSALAWVPRWEVNCPDSVEYTAETFLPRRQKSHEGRHGLSKTSNFD